jgi:polyphosphate kinase 2 (PPK2 family)
MKDFTDSEIKKLSSKRALYYLMQMDNPDYELALEKTSYHKKLRKLQVELIKFQNWVVEKGQRILIIVEGGEFAGKSDLIRAFVEHLNPRSYRAVALPNPTILKRISGTSVDM